MQTDGQSGTAALKRPITMKARFALALVAALSLPAMAEDVPLFNGTDLSGWEGNRELWSVRDGAITGITPPDPADPAKGLIKHNTFENSSGTPRTAPASSPSPAVKAVSAKPAPASISLSRSPRAESVSSCSTPTSTSPPT